MNTAAVKNFPVKPVVAAIALAFSAVTAEAVTPNQMPGAGLVTAVSTGATVNGGGVGTGVVNLIGTPTPPGPPPWTITLSGAASPRAVIQWGGAGTGGLGEVLNPPGFNVGQAANFTVTNTGGGTGALLNIDASGSQSSIFGTVQTNATAFFLANANGITLGPGGRIISLAGVGLIGADLTNSTAKYDFVRNNGAATSFIDVTTGQSAVTISGSINGDPILNFPAQYVLLVGGNVTNTATGNIFGSQVDVAAGIIAAPGTDTVNGVAKTTVNRLWNVDAPGAAVDGVLGAAAPHVALAAGCAAPGCGNFVNLGSVAANTLFGPGWIGIEAQHNISSGTKGDTNQLVGLFADGGIVMDTFDSAGATTLYNGIAGYTTGVTLPFLHINQQNVPAPAFPTFSGTATGDVVIQAITEGSNPSTVTTTGNVLIYGGNITLASSINDKLNSKGGVQTDVNLYVLGTKSLTVSGNVGAGKSVYLNSLGPITISGNVLSDTNESGSGGIYIANFGTGASQTTISGNLTTGTAKHPTFGGIYIYNYGLTSGNLNVSGNLTTAAGGGADVHLFTNGNLNFTGSATGDDDVHVTVKGLHSNLAGPMTATNFFITYAAPHAITTLTPAAVLTAGTEIDLGYDNFSGTWLGVLNFTGVASASGGPAWTSTPYTSASQKPAAQLVTNALVIDALGSVNAPLAAPNTNWLMNGMPISPMVPVAPVNISLTAAGAGPQAINLNVSGNVSMDSGQTVTPFQYVGLTSGFFPAGGLIGNGGSQLIVQASGTLDVQPVGFNGFAFFPPAPAGGTSGVFQFPGGVVLKSGSVLSIFTPVVNAWTTVAQAFQGVWEDAPTIN
ncbi:MAG TPA: hypothetical protein VEN29_19925, partial [Casimicrobiaceae bacterium]|nr:hypothetical protein [Casimicrobiaceae bacterium]